MFLELDPLPGRIADDAAEAALPARCRVWIDDTCRLPPEHVREFEVPVKELVLARQPRYLDEESLDLDAFRIIG